MATARKDLEIEQGATFRHRFEWAEPDGTPINLAGYTGRMQCRSTLDSDEILFELTTENGGLVLNSPRGAIDLYINHAETADIDWVRCLYDLKLFAPNTDHIRIVKGEITVSRSVTHD